MLEDMEAVIGVVGLDILLENVVRRKERAKERQARGHRSTGLALELRVSAVLSTARLHSRKVESRRSCAFRDRVHQGTPNGAPMVYSLKFQLIQGQHCPQMKVSNEMNVATFVEFDFGL